MPEPPSDTVAPAEPVADGRQHLSPILVRYFERDWVRGEGHYLYDASGSAYLDFATGIATTILGHRHPAVSRAICEQAERLVHLCNALGYSEPISGLAADLVATLPDPLDTVFFQNSGSEVIEAAVKLARRSTGRPALIAFSGGFHGRTMAAVALTSSSLNYRAGYQPLLPAVHIAPFPDAYRQGGEEAATQAALAGLDELFRWQVSPADVAAMVIEPVQGEGGYRPAPLAFLRELRRICDRHGILLVADEVQTGLARTGKMWAFQHAGIVPDILCVAKGIANGLPLGVLVSRRELQERWGPGAHGTTFGGNPVACAAARAVLRTIREEQLVENAAARGAELRAGLERLAAQDPGIGDVRGMGLMIGVEFVRDRTTREPDRDRAERLLQATAAAGLLVLLCGSDHNVIRWLAPLNVTPDEVAAALRIFGEVLARDRAASGG
jgi:4-aminobutyrate aminotransferase